MTVEEKLQEVFLERSGTRFAKYPYNDTFDATITAMQEYAEMKCKQLLEIVAEKVETKELFVNGSNGGWYDKVGKVNKDSILNCVDIESFCK